MVSVDDGELRLDDWLRLGECEPGLIGRMDPAELGGAARHARCPFAVMPRLHLGRGSPRRARSSTGGARLSGLAGIDQEPHGADNDRDDRHQ